MAQQTQEVDNAETAAAVAIEDRESAVKKLANAQRALEDAKGKQQHSLQVTASPSALPEVIPVIAESQYQLAPVLVTFACFSTAC